MENSALLIVVIVSAVIIIGLLVTIGMYVLNIIDANVDAHLKQFNVNDNLSVRPNIIPNDFTTNQQNVGLTLNYRF